LTRIRIAAAAAAVVALFAGCGEGGGSGSPATTQRLAATTIAIAAADRPACAYLLVRLQRVSLAIRSSSELVARSLNKQQLTRRIRIEQVQLERSATLMRAGPIPAPLAAADRDLVRALRTYARDFARAAAPAARGDFPAASAAMRDPAVAQRIVRATKTIADAC
jgi:hypothetical protein